MSEIDPTGYRDMVTAQTDEQIDIWAADLFVDFAKRIGVGTAIAAMMLTRTVHPPAGSNPVIVYLAQPGWEFLLFPTLLGSLVVIAVALLYNNATRDARYPKYW